MKTRGALAAPLITFTVLTLFAASSPASLGAAKATPDCPRNSLCVWTKANYRGDRLVIDRLGTSNKIFRRMNDEVSSAALRHPGYATLFEDTNQEGDSLCLLDAPGLRKYPDLSQIGGGPNGYDNIISSSELSEKSTSSCF